MLLFTLYLVVSWLSYVGEECQIASVATTSIAGKPRGRLCRQHFDLWPEPNFFIQHYSKIIAHICFFSAGRTYSHPSQRPEQPCITSNLFHLCPDADDKLILRTNSIITNNPRCWQAHKKTLDEWVVYLLRCTQHRVQAWPAKMPLHYEATEQSAAQPAPVTISREEIGY